MKYLIFGVNGMAGHTIALYLKEQGHKVIGFAKTKSLICQTIIGDAFNNEDVKSALESDKFDIVINCIGVLNKEVDTDMAAGIYLNSVFPHLLAKLLKIKTTKLIHISTDCVFQGNKGRYAENSIPDAESAYGRSKALGEVIDSKNLTLRTSIVGPELKENGIGLFRWFMNQTEPVKGYNKVIWTGVTTLELAKAIEKAAFQNVTGLYHLVNNRTISKYNLLRLFNKYCRCKKIAIQKDDIISSDKSLVNTRTDFDFTIPGYEQMILEMDEWIHLHKELYPRYLYDKKEAIDTTRLLFYK
ncbi:MAG TPA: SDR family oxidoreductase [Mobilitalea sp.]|nr:SDR family oxidoreductase [Mobilitalea sp.]